MRLIFLLGLFLTFNGYGQLKSFILGEKGDTLNVVDLKGMKQGKWIIHVNPLRQ